MEGCSARPGPDLETLRFGQLLVAALLYEVEAGFAWTLQPPQAPHAQLRVEKAAPTVFRLLLNTNPQTATLTHTPYALGKAAAPKLFEYLPWECMRPMTCMPRTPSSGTERAARHIFSRLCTAHACTGTHAAYARPELVVAKTAGPDSRDICTNSACTDRRAAHAQPGLSRTAAC